MLKTFWSEMSEIVKANCKELIYVRESAQSPSLGDPGNIHRTIITTYLALAAVTSMPSMLAVIVKRAGRAVSCGRERQEKERACVEDDDHDEKDWPAGQNKANQSKQH